MSCLFTTNFIFNNICLKEMLPFKMTRRKPLSSFKENNRKASISCLNNVENVIFLYKEKSLVSKWKGWLVRGSVMSPGTGALSVFALDSPGISAPLSSWRPWWLWNGYINLDMTTAHNSVQWKQIKKSLPDDHFYKKKSFLRNNSADTPSRLFWVVTCWLQNEAYVRKMRFLWLA